jgi:hypothetical protein
MIAQSACARRVEDTFAVQDAEPAYVDFSQVSRREPAKYGAIGGSIAVHRLQRGKMWIFGVREFDGTRLFGPTDHERFTKATLVFETAARRTGKFAIDGRQVRLFYSASSPMASGRHGCYASAARGDVEVQWKNEFEFHLLLNSTLDAAEFYPRANQCTGIRLHWDVDGRIRPYAELGPWEGVPISYDLDTDATALQVAWPK